METILPLVFYLKKLDYVFVHFFKFSPYINIFQL